MANKKISALDAVTTLAVSDTMVVVQGGVTKKSSIQKLVDLIPEGQIESGASAYDVAVSNGFVGDEIAWLVSLHGEKGDTGEGVPAGGTTGQVLAKIDGTDYNTEWVDQTGGGGGSIVPTPEATDINQTILANDDGTYRITKRHELPALSSGMGLECIDVDPTTYSAGVYAHSTIGYAIYCNGTYFSRWGQIVTVATRTDVDISTYLPNYLNTWFHIIDENKTEFVEAHNEDTSLQVWSGIFCTGQPTSLIPMLSAHTLTNTIRGYYRIKTYDTTGTTLDRDDIRLILDGATWNYDTSNWHKSQWLAGRIGDPNLMYAYITNPPYILGSNDEDELSLLGEWIDVIHVPSLPMPKPVKILNSNYCRQHVFIRRWTSDYARTLEGMAFITYPEIIPDFDTINGGYCEYVCMNNEVDGFLTIGINGGPQDTSAVQILTTPFSGDRDFSTGRFPGLQQYTLTEAQYLKVASDSPSILNWYTGAADPSIAPLDAPDGAIYLRSDGWVWSKSGGTWTQSAVQLIIPPSHPPTGEMYDDGTSTTVSMATAETYYPITSGFSTGLCNGVTFDSNQLLCLTAGNYFVSWNLTASHSIGDITIGGVVTVNNTEKPQTESVARAKDSGVPYALSGSGIITLAVDDVVKLAVERETGAGTTTLTINHANITMFRIG